MTSSRTLVAALAAALAFPAVAQTRAADEARRAAGQPAQPGAPAAAPGQPGQAAQGQQHQLSQEQLQAIATVVVRNGLAKRAGDLATTRATTPELQALGRQLAEDHQRIADDLARVLRERGVSEWSSLPQVSDQKQLEEQFMLLATRSGPEFDRELTEFLTRNVPEFVESLKRARDVTPGQDASLKKFLDDAENIEENHLAAARRVKANRQARTPPAR